MTTLFKEWEEERRCKRENCRLEEEKKAQQRRDSIHGMLECYFNKTGLLSLQKKNAQIPETYRH